MGVLKKCTCKTCRGSKLFRKERERGRKDLCIPKIVGKFCSVKGKRGKRHQSTNQRKKLRHCRRMRSGSLFWNLVAGTSHIRTLSKEG